MRIAVCDRDRAFLSKFKAMLYTYAKENNIEIFAECFIFGEGIIESDYNYNLIFLSHKLMGMSGLETAETLRKKQNDAPIIFISDCTDFVFDASKVDAFRFLMKANWEKELFPLMNDFFKKSGSSYPLLVKSGEDTVYINTDDIYYLEADNKHCFIHLESESLYCRSTMAKVYSVLPHSRFSKTNRAFVVNLNHIDRYNNEVIILKNGSNLHPSRNYYKSFKDEYRRFLRPYEI